jgi:hypothetical protein
MNNRKCANCGLVNFATSENCRRCGVDLSLGGREGEPPAAEQPVERGFWQKVLWVGGTSLSLLSVCFASLLFSSNPLSLTERETVEHVIAILDQDGYAKEAFVLGHVVHFRGTDNWWNLYVGHQEAYAATNFPFEVVTLYPEFFNFPADDVERAVILLHESQHLFGADEPAALEAVWREKARLGWTIDTYRRTRVWKNVTEWTRAGVPALFRCGADGHSDCVP